MITQIDAMNTMGARIAELEKTLRDLLVATDIRITELEKENRLMLDVLKRMRIALADVLPDDEVRE